MTESIPSLPSKKRRPRWQQALLWALFGIFFGLFLKEAQVLLQFWPR